MSEPSRIDHLRARLRRPEFAQLRRALVLVALVLLAGAWLLGGLLNRRAAREAFPVQSGVLQVEQLTHKLEIIRDKRGIPHLEGQYEEDAWLALGFVHAQDRLGQMLWLRSLARGRTAEIVGAQGLPADRMARTLGIGRAADAEVERLTPETARILEAYAAGVNAKLARLASGRATAPVALVAQSGAPEAWTPADSLAVQKLLAWSVGGGVERLIVLEDILQRLGGKGSRPFFPSGGGVQGVELPFSFPRASVARRTTPAPEDATTADAGALVRAVGFRGGSAVLLSGRHTQSKSPILLADLHLSPTAPALAYEAHLRAGDLDAAGATIPGVPVLWVGRNQNVAWAFTPARAVTVDLFEEEIRESTSPAQNSEVGAQPTATWKVRRGDGWRAVEERREVIRIRTTGGIREEVLTVRETRHGPLVQDRLPPPSSGETRKALALAWTGRQPGDGIGAFVALTRARQEEDVRAALEQHHEPAGAFVFADRGGGGGLQVAGWLPRRGLPAGSVPVHGRQGAFSWRGQIAFEDLVARSLQGAARSGPGRTWMVVADNALVRSPATGKIEWTWRTGARGSSLQDVVSARLAQGPLDLQTAATLQSDTQSAVARAILERSFELLGEDAHQRPESREIATILKNWDGRLDADSRGAAAYALFVHRLIRELMEEPLGSSLLDRYLALPEVEAQSIVVSILDQAAHRPTTEGWAAPDRVKAALRRSLRQSWFSLGNRLGPNRERWRWGGLQNVELRPFSPQREVRGALGGALIGIAGDSTTFALAIHDPRNPFRVETASLYRLAVDLAATDEMLTSLAPGQSGHPLHEHYRDALERWLDGRSSLLVTNRLQVDVDSVETLILNPPP